MLCGNCVVVPTTSYLMRKLLFDYCLILQLSLYLAGYEERTGHGAKSGFITARLEICYNLVRVVMQKIFYAYIPNLTMCKEKDRRMAIMVDKSPQKKLRIYTAKSSVLPSFCPRSSETRGHLFGVGAANVEDEVLVGTRMDQTCGVLVAFGVDVVVGERVAPTVLLVGVDDAAIVSHRKTG